MYEKIEIIFKIFSYIQAKPHTNLEDQRSVKARIWISWKSEYDKLGEIC